MTELEKKVNSFALLLRAQAFAQLVKTKLKSQIAGALSFVTDDFVELLAEVRTELKDFIIPEFLEWVKINKASDLQACVIYTASMDTALENLANHCSGEKPVSHSVQCQQLSDTMTYSSYYLNQIVADFMYSLVGTDVGHTEIQKRYDGLYGFHHQYLRSIVITEMLKSHKARKWIPDNLIT